MYVKNEDLDPETLYQGDILDNFPFIILQNPIFLKSTGKSIYEIDSSSDKWFQNSEEILAVTAKLSRVIILSQTCDIQEREQVIIAPIHPITVMKDTGIFTDGKLGLIRKRKVGYWFYLPEYTGLLEESVVDFQTIYYLHRSIVQGFKKNRVVGLSDWGRHHLGWALGSYFGRPIENKAST